MIRKEIMRFTHRTVMLLVAVAFTQCRSDISIEHEEAATGTRTDTAAVTSFNIKRENTLNPAEWKAYESGREVIVAPSSWVSHLDGIKLIITPPSSVANTEQIAFTRYRKDNPTLDYDELAKQIASKAFENFSISKSDQLEKAELSHDFFYERKANLVKKGVMYKGYCVAYVGDSLFYQFALTLTQARLNSYKGDLIKDIVGNLQINHKYLMDNSNPVKKIIYLRP